MPTPAVATSLAYSTIALVLGCVYCEPLCCPPALQCAHESVLRLHSWTACRAPISLLVGAWTSCLAAFIASGCRCYRRCRGCIGLPSARTGTTVRAAFHVPRTQPARARAPWAASPPTRPTRPSVRGDGCRAALRCKEQVFVPACYCAGRRRCHAAHVSAGSTAQCAQPAGGASRLRAAGSSRAACTADVASRAASDVRQSCKGLTAWHLPLSGTQAS